MAAVPPNLLKNLSEELPDQPSWELIARLLYAGTVYE
jgi:hypothetical protein